MTTMKTRPIHTITTLLFLYTAGLLHAQIQFEQVLPQNFDGVGVRQSSIAFADVDGDGDQDVLITGESSTGQRITQLYTNDGIGDIS